MKPSEHSGRVLRKTSFTQRERLIPLMACSTLTRTRDKARLCRFSPGVNSLPRGFFLVVEFLRHPVHTLETLCLCGGAWQADS